MPMTMCLPQAIEKKEKIPLTLCLSQSMSIREYVDNCVLTTKNGVEGADDSVLIKRNGTYPYVL